MNSSPSSAAAQAPVVGDACAAGAVAGGAAGAYGAMTVGMSVGRDVTGAEWGADTTGGVGDEDDDEEDEEEEDEEGATGRVSVAGVSGAVEGASGKSVAYGLRGVTVTSEKRNLPRSSWSAFTKLDGLAYGRSANAGATGAFP